MARELGTISMVLRKFNDHQKAEVSTVTVEELVTNTPRKTRKTRAGSKARATAVDRQGLAAGVAQGDAGRTGRQGGSPKGTCTGCG